MPPAEHDVAVVGASIAGCTAATLLARQGLRVAVIEQHADPQHYKRVCTHYIQACATPVIRRLGLAEPIEAAGGVRNGVEVWTRYGWIRPREQEHRGRPMWGYDIRREKLDPMVRDLAAAEPGVELLLGRKVTAIVREGGAPVGVLTKGRDGGEEEVRARLVVGADGRDSHIAELAGIEAEEAAHERFAYFAYYEDLPLPTGHRSQMWLADPEVAYAFPQDDGLTLLAGFRTAQWLPAFKDDMEAAFAAMYAELPDAPDPSKGRRVSPFIGKLEMPNRRRPAGANGIALAGDAALAADPLWGVGVGWAFCSGEWLADTLAGPLLRGEDLDAPLRAYAKRHKRELRLHHQLMNDYSRVRPFNPFEKLMYRAAATDQRTADRFQRVGVRVEPPTAMFRPRTLGRMLWAAARSGPADQRALFTGPPAPVSADADAVAA
jgi:2-polyprenyl-6-methoxyphenol hydroxylase-like FAD-dependent oxidoreductase